MGVHYVLDNTQVYDYDLVNNELVKRLLNKPLGSLYDEGFIVFPAKTESSDLHNNTNQCIFKTWNGEMYAGNVVGTLIDTSGDQETEIRIVTRFNTDAKLHDDKLSHPAHKNDYFLRYMIQTVLDYNVIDQSLKSSTDSDYYDILSAMFPYYLHEAMKKGQYKEYVRKEFNDSNVKGTIDIARHIRMNEPFMGRVAYHTSEFNYDNNVTELIRHTIEKLEKEGQPVLTANAEVKPDVRQIKQTTGHYNRLNRQKIIQTNISNPVKHGYFSDYAILQNLCIQILSGKKSGYGSNRKRVSGIIIDVAWLWENYIAKITSWQHYGRITALDTMNFYSETIEDCQQTRYPDFVFNSGIHGFPIDTKYKPKIDKRNDYNQLTTYIHLMQSSRGGFLQPVNKQNKAGYHRLGLINGGDEELFVYRFYIPTIAPDDTYQDFVLRMRRSESDLIEHFNKTK